MLHLIVKTGGWYFSFRVKHIGYSDAVAAVILAQTNRITVNQFGTKGLVHMGASLKAIYATKFVVH